MVLIHSRDHRWSMVGLKLGSSDVCLCLSVTSYWEASLLRTHGCAKSCIFFFVESCSKGKKNEKMWLKKREIKDLARKKGTTLTSCCFFCLCLHFSISRPHKEDDHRRRFITSPLLENSDLTCKHKEIHQTALHTVHSQHLYWEHINKRINVLITARTNDI